MSNHHIQSPFSLHKTPKSPMNIKDPRTNPSISNFSNIQKTIPNFQKSINNSEKIFKENLGNTLSPINNHSREEELLGEISYCKDEVDQLKAEIKKFNNVLRVQYNDMESKGKFKEKENTVDMPKKQSKKTPHPQRFPQQTGAPETLPARSKYSGRGMNRNDKILAERSSNYQNQPEKSKSRYPSKEKYKNNNENQESGKYSNNPQRGHNLPGFNNSKSSTGFTKQVMQNYEEEISFLREQNGKLREVLFETEKKLEEERVIPKPDFGVMKMVKKVLFTASQAMIQKAEHYHQRNSTAVDIFGQKMQSMIKNLTYMKSMSECESRKKKKEISNLEKQMEEVNKKIDGLLRENIALKNENSLGAQNLIKSQQSVNKLMREVEIVKQTKHIAGDKEGINILFNYF